MLRHLRAAPVLMLLIVPCGCAQRPPTAAAGAGAWRLVHPPETRDERYPRGYRIRSDAPLATWHATGTFATRAECERTLVTRIDDTIDQARAVHGEDAKNELTVRRAVNARCVEAQ